MVRDIIETATSFLNFW